MGRGTKKVENHCSTGYFEFVALVKKRFFPLVRKPFDNDLSLSLI